jgi:SecD/SecF fusion protein
MALTRHPGTAKASPLQGAWWKVATILLVVGGCLLSVFPPQERIRLGRDLRGGVSLVYHVNVDPDDPDPQNTLEQVIAVLKQRVNPQGVLDISFSIVGRDRIEVVMPLPGERVLALRREYEDARQALLAAGRVPPGDLRRALEAGNASQRFGAQGERGARIRDLQDAFDAYQSAVAALEQARREGRQGAELNALADAQASTGIIFEDLQALVLGMNLDAARVERALRLSTTPQPVLDESGKPRLDPATGEPLKGPSPRDLELQSIKGDFADLSGPVDTLVTTWEAYAAQRTGFDDPEDLMRLLRGAGVLEFRIAVRAGDPKGVNPEDLRRQLRERGPTGTDSTVARWFRINDLKQWYDSPEELQSLQADPIAFFVGNFDLVAAERDGEHFLLLYVVESRSLTHEADRAWSVTGTALTVDNFGRNAVRFDLDETGGLLMRRLTANHINEPMAIVLDGEVYSAPRIQDAIGKSGIITGTFSEAELNYLIRVLAAGSLQARLTPDPIAMNTLGPSIGRDNLNRGLEACLIAIVAVALFMVAYYFFAGLVANAALLSNGIMIFGVMAMIDGTFTLPGLAGIALTMGMAVDANVLIYERIREELRTGEVDLRGAIKLGYARALSTILDANITTLVVGGVLYATATTEVRGFALTLCLGICATLFSALFMTRVFYLYYTEVGRARRLRMLPSVIPAVQRALEPRIDWMRLRMLFIPLSLVAVAASGALVAVRGVDIFDTEFRGGVAVTMRTRALAAGEPGVEGETRLLLPHVGPGGVETRVQGLAGLLEPGGDPQDRNRLLAALHAAGVLDRGPQELPPADRYDTDPQLLAAKRILRSMGSASVLTVGRTRTIQGSVHGERFQIKVAAPREVEEEKAISDVVVAAIVSEFGGELDVTGPLDFRGAGEGRHAGYTYPVTEPSLGRNINRPRHTDPVEEYLGGVALVIEEIDPPTSPDGVARRIERMRAQPDFAALVARKVGVFGLDPADPLNPDLGYRSVAVCVLDPALAYGRVDLELWDSQLAAAEWGLVSSALQRQTSLEEVRSFSSAVAATLSAQAVVAVFLSLLGILIYIWIRFGSVRYSLAAIIALIHDVAIALGLLALTGWLARVPAFAALGIGQFRINLEVIAALLTIIGYSINDTIVILDRIRENRGKLPIPTADIVNRAINQTMSRTVLTAGTTIMALLVMYIAGGPGLRPFSFVMLGGLISGTYSSVAIAAPLVVRGRDIPPPVDAGARGTTAAREPTAVPAM